MLQLHSGLSAACTQSPHTDASARSVPACSSLWGCSDEWTDEKMQTFHRADRLHIRVAGSLLLPLTSRSPSAPLRQGTADLTSIALSPFPTQSWVSRKAVTTHQQTLCFSWRLFGDTCQLRVLVFQFLLRGRRGRRVSAAQHSVAGIVQSLRPSWSTGVPVKDLGKAKRSVAQVP